MLETRYVRASTIVVLVLLLCFVPLAASGVKCRLEQAPVSGSEAPFIVIPRIGKAPKIDGVLGPHEWDGAECTTRFLVVGTTQRADPPTKAWLAVDGSNLYAAFRCTLAPRVEPKAATKAHDGPVHMDDAIQFIVWPDLSKKNYYQFAANCAGTRADVVFTWVAGAHTELNRAWNPKWIGRTGRERGAWTLEMAVPLSAIGLRPHGSHLVRLNICRDIWLGRRSVASWAYLSNKSGDTHSRPLEYGVGICTFGAGRGRQVDFAKITGLKGLDLLGVTDRDRIVMLPGDYSVTASPFAALPAKLVSDGGFLLQASLSPTLAAGKDGQPTQIGKMRLKSSGPVAVTLEDLQPGDYKLRLSLSGLGKSSTVERLIQARKPLAEPEIAGTVVIDDSDWRSEAAIVRSAGIEHSLMPELLLQTQFRTPVLAFDPTDDETITCMTEFQEKLYVGSCTQPAITDTGSVFRYDPELDIWRKVFQVNEQGLVKMEVFGDKLYIPGYDANDGGWDLGNIYIHDGKSWIEKRTVPRAVHIYGLVVYHDRIYVSADIFDPAPEGVPYQEALDKDMLDIYGRVVSSGDGGQTWREEYRGKRPTQDIGYMTVFQDKIILNASNDLVVFDGQKWTPMGLSPAVLFVYDYAQEGDTLMLATQHGLFFHDGSRLWRSNRVWCPYLRGMAEFGDNWILAGYYIAGGGAGHGPGGGNYPAFEKKDAAPVYPNLLVYSRKLLMEPPDYSGRVPNELWKGCRWIRSKETCVSCRSFRGRVYLGTHPEGRVLVLPVCTAGTLVSVPRKLDGSGVYRLWWSAATPPGTSVSLQIRTASSVEGIEKKPFVGPDGGVKSHFVSPGTAFEVAGPTFFQYRVTLRTADAAKTPYVKHIVLTSSGS